MLQELQFQEQVRLQREQLLQVGQLAFNLEQGRQLQVH
jgi:hypothetical protein